MQPDSAQLRFIRLRRLHSARLRVTSGRRTQTTSLPAGAQTGRAVPPRPAGAQSVYRQATRGPKRDAAAPPRHGRRCAATPRPAPPLARAACFSTSRSGSRAAPRWRRAEYEKCGGQWSRAAPRGRRVGYEKHDWLCTAAVNGVVWWGEARLSGRRRTSGNRSFRQGPPLAGVLPTRALQSQGTSTPGICI